MDTQQALNILGLDPNFSPVELKRVYREQVRLWHPDRYSRESAMKLLAEKHLRDANLAYTLLKRRTPQATSARPSGRWGALRSHPSLRPSPGISSRIGGLIQVMAHLKRLFPKIEFNSVRQWLRHDIRNSFRPWYRYPDASESSVSQGRESASFSQILHNTLRRPSDLHRLRHQSPSRRPTDGADIVTPVGSVSSVRKAQKK